MLTSQAFDTTDDRIRVLFLMPRLDTGGAQRQLVEVVRAFDKDRFDVAIAPMYPGGELLARMASLEGVSVRCLDKTGRYDVFGFFVRLARLVRHTRPHVIQTHGASAIFGLVASAVGRCGLIVGIRNSNMDLKKYGWLEPKLFAVGRYVSRAADLLIANSHAGKAHYAAHGYPEQKIRVVPNGFDTDAFRPWKARGRALRREWGIADDQILIGIVARLDPAKDHESFLRAAALVAARDPRARFAVIGEGPAPLAARLKALAHELGIADRVVWPGLCEDMLAAHNTLDICASTSTTEGLSNSIGEAMCCAVPCTGTDVGDSAFLIGDRSRITPPARPDLAAECWLRLLALPAKERSALGEHGRQRIVDEFSIRLAATRMQDYIESAAR